jgi:Protein of unknown function (DUF1588)/Protein of unknown function (DUF1592)/Protein of unknown function (DUF1595)/Protein of unknown function (DUF1585)/Protein of unknown function (DUF1587)
MIHRILCRRTPPQCKSRLIVLGCSLLVAACTASSPTTEDVENPVPMGGNAGSGGETPAPVAIAANPLLRLTALQYKQSVHDLLGVQTQDVSLPPDGKSGLFSGNAGLTLSLLGFDQYIAAAETLALRAQPRLADLSGCKPAQASEERNCVNLLIANIAARAYRRALQEGDRVALLKVFDAARPDMSYAEAAALVIQGILIAPEFLYRVERGGEAENGRRRLSSFEQASRLAFLLTDTIPDTELWRAAEENRVNSDTEIKQQFERMWQSATAAQAQMRFHREWLALDRLDTLSKDPKRYPFFDDSVKSAMRSEVDAFVTFSLHKGGGHLQTMLTAPVGFPVGPLYRVYGLQEATMHDAALPVGLSPTQRAGILTLPAVMATHASADLTSPVHRGLFVFRNLLCQDLPPPPSGVNTTPIRADAVNGMTRREQFAAHEADPSCGGCHSVFDPIGFAFESYDAVGAYRTMDFDENAPVNSSATIETGTDIDGAVANGVELVGRIARSRDVHNCYTRHWWSFALGRPVQEQDETQLSILADGFAASAGDIRTLAGTLTLSDAFRFRADTRSQ